MDYFNYSNEGYGKTGLSKKRYIYFLHIEAIHVGGASELEMFFYYRVEEKTLELVMVTEKGDFETKWYNIPISALCREYCVEIIPSPFHDHIAECICPTSTIHRIIMNLATGSWFCGHCGKNGYLEELKQFFEKYRSE